MRWTPLIVVCTLLVCNAFMAATKRSSPASPRPPTVHAVSACEGGHAQAFEIIAFEERTAPAGGKFQYFEITAKDADGSARRILVKVESSLIEDWATKTIKSKLSW